MHKWQEKPTLTYVIENVDHFTITGFEGEQIARLQVDFIRYPNPDHGMPDIEVTSCNGLWVHHEHRGQKLGRKLFDAVIAKYGHNDLYLTVWAYNDQPVTNAKLIAFYKSLGFVWIHEAPGRMIRRGTPQPMKSSVSG